MTNRNFKAVVIWILALVPLSLLVPSEIHAALDESDYEKVNARIIESHIRPRYAALAAASEALAKAADRFSTAPSEEHLASLRQAFHVAMNAWMDVEHIRFGPSQFQDRADRFFFWPDRHNTGSRQIAALLKAQDRAALAPGTFTDATAAIQGLPAMERLLFGETSVPILLKDGPEARYRREILVAIGHNLMGLAGQMAEAWEANADRYGGLITAPDANNPFFKDHKAVTTAIFKSLQNGLTRIDIYKLTRPLGDGCEKPRPRRSESWRSGRSNENLIINLSALRDLYGDEDALYAIRKYHLDPRLDQKLREGFETALMQVQSFSRPLAEMVESSENCEKVAMMQNQIQSLSKIVEGELAQALELSAGFNFSDGD